MEKAFHIIESIAASGTALTKDINLVRTRTISITVRLTCGSSIDADTTVAAQFSPDGINWDSIAFTSWAITYTASGTIQKTVVIDPPEHGMIRFLVTNGSSADSLTNIRLWYTIQSWDDYKKQMIE